MKLLATFLAIGQSYEEPIFGRPSDASGPEKRIHVATCIEKFGPLSLENVKKVSCFSTPEELPWGGKGFCQMHGCSEGYIRAKRGKGGSKLYCLTDESETKVWFSDIPYTCGTCSQTVDEVEALILANSPKMKIKKRVSKSIYSSDSLSFKCGKAKDKKRILPFGWNKIGMVACTCNSETGECNWQRQKRKFDIGDNWDFNNWFCHELDFSPTGNHKIPSGLSCNNEDRVFGGEQALSSSHPWLVYISARAAKINDSGDVSAHPVWKSGCQGVLVDAKTVVTTADCATSMPEAKNGALIGWASHDDKVLSGYTSLGKHAYHKSLIDAIQACESLPKDDCRGVSYEYMYGGYSKGYIPRSGNQPMDPTTIYKSSVHAWVRPSSSPDGSDGFEYEISAGHDDKGFKNASEVSNHIQRFVSTLDGSHQKIHIHPDVNLAVLKLNEPFEMNSKISTACLPTQNQSLPRDTPCYFAAWGLKTKGWPWKNSYNDDYWLSELHKKKLRETDLPMLTEEECKASGWSDANSGEIYSWVTSAWTTSVKPEHFADLDNQICAGHKDKNGVYDAQHGIAPGDDGAPLICVVDNKPVFMGAAIYTDSSLHFPNFPNLFTSVPKQVEWIQQFMEN